MPGFTVLAVPHFFQAGQSRTSRASPLLMFMATAPPLDEPTTTCGLVLVELVLGDPDGLLEVVVGQLRVDDLVAVVLEVGRFDAARNRLPAVEEEDGHGAKPAFALRQFGQYHGAGVLTGFGLRLRHLAQRKRLPFKAVFGRTFLPVLRMFFALGPMVSTVGVWPQRPPSSPFL